MDQPSEKSSQSSARRFGERRKKPSSSSSSRWKCSDLFEQSFVSRGKSFECHWQRLGGSEMGLCQCYCSSDSGNGRIDLLWWSYSIVSTRLWRSLGTIPTRQRQRNEKRSDLLSSFVFIFVDLIRWSDRSCDESSRRDSRARSSWFVHSFRFGQSSVSRQRQDEQHLQRIRLHHLPRQEGRSEGHRVCLGIRLWSFDSQSRMGQVNHISLSSLVFTSSSSSSSSFQ